MNTIIKHVIQENFPGWKNIIFLIKSVHQNNGFKKKDLQQGILLWNSQIIETMKKFHKFREKGHTGLGIIMAPTNLKLEAGRK